MNSTTQVLKWVIQEANGNLSEAFRLLRASREAYAPNAFRTLSSKWDRFYNRTGLKPTTVAIDPQTAFVTLGVAEAA